MLVCGVFGFSSFPGFLWLVFDIALLLLLLLINIDYAGGTEDRIG